jgi:transposase InsO family protein
MVLIDTPTRWSHVCLLSIWSHSFAKIMVQVIKLKASFLENRIQTIQLDNATEFSSWAFNDYYKAQGIQLQHYVPYVHTQNGVAESLIKRIKLIARSLLHNCNLPISCWVHAVLHITNLIQLRPTTYHSIFLLYLVRGNAPTIFYLWKFWCAV